MGRKGKAVQASSAKALEVCGTTSNLGISAADIFAQFAAPSPAAAVPASRPNEENVCVADAEVSMALQLLQKKDPQSRLRGVGDLRTLLADRPPDVLKDTCSKFLNMYQSMWPQDSEPRVREGLQRCLQALVEGLQRDFARHLRNAFPSWLCAMFDTHPEVAQAARRAFTAAFTTDEKRRGVFRHCQAECLELLTSNLRHSEQSLHEALGIAASVAPGDRNCALERQDRYARVISASLSALGELVHVCASPPPSVGAGEAKKAQPLLAEDLTPLFESGSSCALWPRLASKQPALVRRAAAECLVRILQSPAASAGVARASARASVLNTLADDAVPAGVAAALVCVFAEVGGEPSWEGLSAGKNLWPQLLAGVKRGAPRDPHFLERLSALLGALPASAWGPERGLSLLRALLDALKVQRCPASDAWRAYFAVVRAADAAEAPVEASWRWIPIELYLGTRDGAPPTGQEPAGDGPAAEAKPAAAMDSRLPAPALAALPEVLNTVLPEILRERSASGNELAAALEAAAECLEVAASAARWKKWLALLTPLLSGDLAARATALVAERFRRTIAAIVAISPEQSDAPSRLPLLETLGHFLSHDSVVPEGSWMQPGDKQVVAALEALGPTWEAPAQLCAASASWPPEAALLLWPLLPLWRAWLRHGAEEAALQFGNSVVRPLLGAALQRHGSQLPKDDLRNVVASALLGNEAVAEAGLRERSRLGVAVRLVFEALPPQLAAAEAPLVDQAVGLLAAAVASGDWSGEAALRLALRPEGVRPESSKAHLRTLIAALDSDCQGWEGKLRLSVLCGNVLKCRAAADERCAFRGPIVAALLAGLLHVGQASAQVEKASWTLLPSILTGMSSAEFCSVLGGPPAIDCGRWVRIMVSASSALQVPVLELACASRGGYDGVRLQGHSTAEQLKGVASATGELLRAAGRKALASLGEGPVTEGVAALLWEVLLAEAALLQAREAADMVWTWLAETSPSTCEQFVLFCAQQAAEEGGKWSLSSSGAESLPVLARLHGVAALRRLLLLACSSELLGWALERASKEHEDAPGWGFVAAAVVEQRAALECDDAASMLAAVARWRGTFRTTSASSLSQQLRPAALRLAAAVEVWAPTTSSTRAPTAGPAAEEEPDDEPVIAEVMVIDAQGVAAAASAANATVVGEVDTSIMETHERLLRWAQDPRNGADAPDAFAAYVAATWPALLVSHPELNACSRQVQRMHRFALEVLTGRAAGAAPAPGALRLVAALAAAGLWPAQHWPATLEALVDADALSLGGLAASQQQPATLVATPEGCLAPESETAASSTQAQELSPKQQHQQVARAFVAEVSAAAAAVVWHAPLSLAPKVVPLLGASEQVLRAAVAGRLRQRTWVPLDHPGEAERAASDEAEARAEAFGSLEALLQEEQGEGDGDESDLPPAPSDVGYAALAVMVGAELASEAWQIGGALAAFLAWEAGLEAPGDADREEDGEGGAESAEGASARSAAQAAAVAAASKAAAAERAATAASNCGGSSAGSSEVLPPLPVQSARRCAAGLAAWELVLLSIDAGCTGAGGSDIGSGTFGGPARPKPAELLAAALQLAPEQLQGPRAALASAVVESAAGLWPEEDSEDEAADPLRALLRLVCHALSSPRLLGEKVDAHSLLGVALAAAAPGPVSTIEPTGVAPDAGREIFCLAGRVFLLLLRLVPSTARAFWEALPRRRDRDIVERLVIRSFAPLLAQAEAAAASGMLQGQNERLPDIEAVVVRRPQQLVLQLAREDLKAELCIQLPEGFPLRMASAELPEKMPGIPKPRVRNWMLQARQVLAGPKPMGVGRVMLMWAKSFSLYFDGVEDCPICYNVVHMTSQTIPKKVCTTCKHKFHSECLYHWFKSSAKTTCPLCNQPF